MTKNATVYLSNLSMPIGNSKSSLKILRPVICVGIPNRCFLTSVIHIKVGYLTFKKTRKISNIAHENSYSCARPKMVMNIYEFKSLFVCNLYFMRKIEKGTEREKKDISMDKKS